jgi:DNA-binding NarL/FixJ family response regulator
MFVWVRESVKSQILPPAAEGAARTSRHWCITRREREVLMGVALGFSNKAIALSLHISRKTVDKHRGNVMRKLDLHCASDLARFAIQEGLIDLTGKFWANAGASIGLLS